MAKPKQRDFQDVLTDLDEGGVHNQLTDLWPRLIQAVRETNKAGAVVITINAKSDRGNMVVISAKVASRIPQPSTNPTFFYADEEGNTTRHDPKQQLLKNVSAIKPLGGGAQ